MDLLFGLCVALLFTHELDAVRGKEWLLLPGLNSLQNETGRAIFIALHVPLFWLILALCWSADAATQDLWRMIVAGFGPVHYGLHRQFSDHPRYDFASPLSRGLIIGYGVLGAMYLALALAI